MGGGGLVKGGEVGVSERVWRAGGLVKEKAVSHGYREVDEWGV